MKVPVYSLLLAWAGPSLVFAASVDSRDTTTLGSVEYSIPTDTNARLITTPGGPSIGQPHVVVNMRRRLEHSDKTKRPRTEHYLLFEIPALVNAAYQTLDLYVGCRVPGSTNTTVFYSSAYDSPPTSGGSAGQGQSHGSAVSSGGGASTGTTGGGAEFKHNFSQNCHMRAGGLGAECEVPVGHLVHDKQLSTGCERAADGKHFGCGAGHTVKVAVRGEVARDGGPGGQQTLFEVVSQGACVAPAGKRPAGEAEWCDEKKRLFEQYFEFEIKCTEKEETEW